MRRNCTSFSKNETIVLPRGELNRVVLRIICLHEHFAGKFAAPGAARHLRQQLKRALGGAKIRQAEREIGGDHADERDALKIVALRDHLRADQDVDLARRKRAQHLLVGALGAHGVAVQARDARFGKLLAQFFFERSAPAPKK